jgi:hypothetical protein
MFAGLWVTVGMVALVVILIVKTMGWTFYNRGQRRVLQPLPVRRRCATGDALLYPVMFARWLVDNHLFQALLLIVMGLWFFGWAGTCSCLRPA